MENSKPDFANKIVAFSTVTDSTLAIENPTFESQFERLFVVGHIPKGATTNDWAAGRPCAIAWESITDYIVFDTNEQYLELLEKSES